MPGKVLARIVAARLGGFAEGILAESANGFRPARGTMDCVALVRALIDRAVGSVGGTLHCVFVDLRKAFDAVHRQGLWLTLRRHGLPAVSVHPGMVDTRAPPPTPDAVPTLLAS